MNEYLDAIEKLRWAEKNASHQVNYYQQKADEAKLKISGGLR